MATQSTPSRTHAWCRTTSGSPSAAALLAKEKEFTRLRDELSRQRRELPWEKVAKSYVFDGPRRQADAGRPVRAAQPAHRLPLHVRPGLGRGVQELLVRRRQLRRERSCTSAHATPPSR